MSFITNSTVDSQHCNITDIGQGIVPSVAEQNTASAASTASVKAAAVIAAAAIAVFVLY